MTKKRLFLNEIIKRFFLYLFIVFLVVIFLTPIVVMIFTSLKSPEELVYVFKPPMHFYLDNFEIAFDTVGRSFLNSIIMISVAVPLSIFIAALAAYPLSQFQFKSNYFISLFLLIGMFIPYQIALIPLFQIMRFLKLYDTIYGMWFVHSIYGIPICTFFLRNYFSTIPKAMFEAALIDGVSITGYFFRILLPLSKTGLAALAIIQTRYIWNELLFGLTLTASENVEPITIKLSSFVGATDVQYGPLMAATLLSILPTTIVFLFFRRQFIQGILMGNK